MTNMNQPQEQSWERIRKLIEGELWTGDVLPYDGITRLVEKWDGELSHIRREAVEERDGEWREKIKTLRWTDEQIKYLGGTEAKYVAYRDNDDIDEILSDLLSTIKETK